MNTNKTEEVKTHLSEKEFEDFLSNLSMSGYSNRSEWMRDQIRRFNRRCAKAALQGNNTNIIELF